MKRKAIEILEKEEMRNAIVVLDCTGLTKPAGIALYEIARDYFFPLVYVYVKTGKIKWLVSRDYVSQRLTSKPEQDLYEDLLEDLSNRKSEVFRDAMEILRLLGEKGGVAGFNDIASYLKSLRGAKEREPSVAKHLIGILEEHDIIQRVRIEGGPYALKYKTPFCWLFGKDRVEYVYFGLLGAWRPPGREIVTKTALNLLKNDGYQVSQIHILTTQSGYDAWRKELDELRKEYQELRRSDILHYYLCPEQEVDDFGVIKRIIEPFIQSLLRDYVVILDGTGLTKPATLAMYELARKYCIPMIYVYEAERRLHWCVSKESISERLGYTMKSSRGRIYRPREGIGGAIAVSES
jgi:DNA-directed RNA polymerase subunit K/omega